MEALTTYQPQAPTVQEAMNGREAQLIKRVTDLILSCYQYCGIAKPDVDVAATVALYLADLKRYFPDIETTEIKEIFTSGLHGELGEWYGLNARTFYTWTSRWMKKEGNGRRKQAAYEAKMKQHDDFVKRLHEQEEIKRNEQLKQLETDNTTEDCGKEIYRQEQSKSGNNNNNRLI